MTRSLYKLIKSATYTFRWELFILCLVYVSQSLLSSFFPYFTKLTIDSVLAISEKGISIKMFYLIFNWATVDLIGFGSGIMLSLFSVKLRSFLRQRFQEEIYEVSYKEIYNISSGNIANKSVAFPKAIENILFSFLFYILPQIIFIIVGLYTMKRIDNYFIISFILFTIVAFLYFLKTFNKLKIAYEAAAEATASISAYVVDFIKNIILVKLFKGEEREKIQLKKEQDIESEKIKYSWILSEKNYYIQNILYLLFFSINLLILLHSIVSGNKISAGDITLVIMTTFRLTTILSGIQRTAKNILTDFGLLSSINEIFQKENKENIKKQTIRSFDIEFEKVCFSYTQNVPIINNINFLIKEGENVGILGTSGSGKTTIIKLLTKLYSPDSGTIKIGSINIEDISENYLRDYISVSSQDSPIFNRSIIDNIMYSNPKVSKKELEEVLAITGCYKQFKNLDLIVGEAGNKISGGQRQRISIARSLLKPAPIMVFDEAFSSIEEKTSLEMIQLILDRLVGHTVILISHNKKQIDLAEKKINIS